MEYKVGDIIEYQTYGGGKRVVLVSNKEAKIKNGKPGFDGSTITGPGPELVWGYDYQITRVFPAIK